MNIFTLLNGMSCAWGKNSRSIQHNHIPRYNNPFTLHILNKNFNHTKLNQSKLLLSYFNHISYKIFLFLFLQKINKSFYYQLIYSNIHLILSNYLIKIILPSANIMKMFIRNQTMYYYFYALTKRYAFLAKYTSHIKSF